MHLFDTDTSPTHLIAHTCTAIDTCTVEDGPIDIPRPTVHATPKQTTPRLQHENPPPYITTPLGIHVNVGEGAFETRAYGIFVVNVNFKASSKDLREHFGRAGRITECLLQRHRSTSRVKGNATLQFASPENIRKAVEMFDGEPFMGRRLRVRLDRVFAVSNPPPTPKPRVDGGVGEGDILRRSAGEDGPVIVDGSRLCHGVEWNDERETG